MLSTESPSIIASILWLQIFIIQIVIFLHHFLIIFVDLSLAGIKQVLRISQSHIKYFRLGITWNYTIPLYLISFHPQNNDYSISADKTKFRWGLSVQSILKIEFYVIKTKPIPTVNSQDTDYPILGMERGTLGSDCCRLILLRSQGSAGDWTFIIRVRFKIGGRIRIKVSVGTL